MEINPGDVVNAEVRKANVKQEAGLKLEERDGRIYVRKVDGLFKRRSVPVEAGDLLHTINGKDVEDYPGGLDEIKALIKNEMKIWIIFERMDGVPEDDDVSYEEGYEEEEVLMIKGNEDYQSEEEYEEYEEEEVGDVLRLTQAPGTNSSGIESGKEMRLFKLKKKPKLNGTIVRVLNPAEREGRWEVKILRHPMRSANVGAVMSIDEGNLISV